jgi:Holliday junction resolvase RusA-like endonuclease
VNNPYHIILPLPPSVNDMWQYNGPRRPVSRSKAYEAWIEHAGIWWRRQYPSGAPKLLQGRLLAQYVFFFIDARPHDIFNREKCLSDYLERKFYANDSQIDEGHVMRRIDRSKKANEVHVWLTEIEDRRFVDIFNPGVGG